MATQPTYRFDDKALTPFLTIIGSYHQDMILQPSRGTLDLFHYTDLAGLQGILLYQDLWLTNSRYSNDSEEMVHGINAANKVLNANPASPYLDIVKQLLAQPEGGVYVCCFCEKNNLLSQWRSYGANGTGVSLQFDPNGFSSIAGPDCPSGLLRLWKVFYEATRQEDIVQKAIDFFAPASPYQQPGCPVDLCARQAADAIRFFIPTFKNPDFSEEKEWRLIFTPSLSAIVPLRFRVSRNILVPYYSMKELCTNSPAPASLPIKGLCIGPSSNKQLNVESARLLLLQNGFGAVPVTASDTPYRG